MRLIRSGGISELLGLGYGGGNSNRKIVRSVGSVGHDIK